MAPASPVTTASGHLRAGTITLEDLNDFRRSEIERLARMFGASITQTADARIVITGRMEKIAAPIKGNGIDVRAASRARIGVRAHELSDISKIATIAISMATNTPIPIEPIDIGPDLFGPHVGRIPHVVPPAQKLAALRPALPAATLTVFPDLRGATKSERRDTLAGWKSWLVATVAPVKAALPLVSGGRFGTLTSDKNSLRHAGNLEGIRTLIAEHDGETVPVTKAFEWAREADVAVLIYSTPSHTPEKPRWRAVLVLSREITAGEAKTLIDLANGVFRGALKGESWDIVHAWYAGHVDNAPFEVLYHEGRPIDLIDSKTLPAPIPKPASASNSNGGGVGAAAASVAGLGPKPPHIAAAAGLDLNQNAAAGLDWFDQLTEDGKNSLVLAGLGYLSSDVGRADWLKIVFACADAERCGATAARASCDTWSQLAPSRYGSAAKFAADWNSFRPKQGGTTVGTLIWAAARAGFDVAAWLAATQRQTHAVSAASVSGSGAAPPGVTASSWTPPNPRPVIQVRPGTFHIAADSGISVMLGAGVPFYQQGGRPVGVCRIPVKLATGVTIPTPSARVVPLPVLTRALTQCADWRRWSGGQWVKVEPPKEVVAQVHAVAAGSFPPLRGISATPVMRPDGSLLSAAGYDQGTGLVLFEPPPLPPMPSQPTRHDAFRALKLLDDLLAEFPFKNDKGVSRSAALCLVITAVQRGVLETAPMFVIVKPLPGTGGSYLVDIVAAIAIGSRAPVMAWSVSKDENEKRLVAAALAQQPIIALDNVSGTLRSDMLCQLAERTIVKCRPLGRSEQIEIAASSLVVANGNNLSITTDEVRRTIQIDLDANAANPDDRQFRRRPVDEILKDRGKYIAAVLTIIRAYRIAGCPGRLSPRPSYEAWSDMIRSALAWLGQPDPVLSVNAVRAQDTVATQRAAVFDAWAAELGLGSRHRTSELVESTREETFSVKTKCPALREALLAVAPVRGRPSTIDPTRLGQWLKRQENTISGSRKLTVDRSDQARPRFVLDVLTGARRP